MRFDVSSRSGRMLTNNVAKRCDCRSMMAQGRSVGLIAGGRGMTGSGIFDSIRSLFTRGAKLYHQAQPYVKKAKQAYEKFAPQAEKAYKIYKSDSVQKFVPEGIKRREKKAAKFAKEKFKVAEDLYNDVTQFGKTVREGVSDSVGEQNLMKKVKEKPALPADNLRKSLLGQVRQGKALKNATRGSVSSSSSSSSLSDQLKQGRSALKASSSRALALAPKPATANIMDDLKAKLASHRGALKQDGEGLFPPGLVGSGHCGGAMNPPGLTGAGAWGDVFKLAAKMIPTIVGQIQQGSGMNKSQAKQLLKLSLAKARPILSGACAPQKGKGIGDFFKSLADAVITPLNLVSNISKSAAQSGSGRRRKKQMVLKQYSKHIAKVLAKSMTRKQTGSGVSFGDVLNGIAQTASTILPFIL